MQSRFRDWGDVRVFLAVAREGSTLAASRVLGITQTTAARRVDALEHALGLTLFDRDTRGFHLTADGDALLAPAEALEAAAQALDRAAQDRHQAARPIVFTAFDHAMNIELAGIFEQFAADNPGTSFEFIASEKPLDLVAGEADVALRLTPGDLDPRLIGRRVGHGVWTYYSSHRYAETRGVPKSFDDGDMAGHTVVLLHHFPSRRPSVLRCDNVSELMMAIRTGRGIGPIPTFQGDRDPGLVRCFPPPPNAELPAWLLASPAAHRRPEVRRFLAFAAPRIARYLKELG